MARPACSSEEEGGSDLCRGRPCRAQARAAPVGCPAFWMLPRPGLQSRRVKTWAGGEQGGDERWCGPCALSSDQWLWAALSGPGGQRRPQRGAWMAVCLEWGPPPFGRWLVWGHRPSLLPSGVPLWWACLTSRGPSRQYPLTPSLSLSPSPSPQPSLTPNSPRRRPRASASTTPTGHTPR